MRIGFVLDGTVIAFLLLGSACGRTADHDGDTDGDTGSSETNMSDTGTSDTGGCLADELFCDGVCVADDDANCGECGNQCGAMYSCYDGECRHNCDEGGGDYCDGECVFVDEDDQHCGQCNNPCGPGENCESGQCTPSDTTGDGDGDGDGEFEDFPDNWPCEDGNDTWETAWDIVVNGAIPLHAVFCENDTFDWYRIVVGPADETDGDVSWCPSEGTIALALFESDAQTLIEEDEGANGHADFDTDLPPGTYYLRLEWTDAVVDVLHYEVSVYEGP